MKDFRGKVAVITGGASGIGLAYAEAFGAKGARIVLADIEKSRLDSAVERLSGKGIEAFGRVTDVTKFDDVEGLASDTIDRYGKAHLIFNNAGVSITGPTWLQTIDDWRWVYDVNIFGVIHGIKAFVPILLKQNEPSHIINTASLASFNGTGDHAPYCSSKAAALSISQALFSEMRALMAPVGVTAVCPGMVDTAINKSWRNRPKADKPWSDREFANKEFMKGSNAFQAAGITAEEVAQLTLDAVTNGRFYVFTGENPRAYVETFLGSALNAANPPVWTWGEDRRPEAERSDPLWRSMANTPAA